MIKCKQCGNDTENDVFCSNLCARNNCYETVLTEEGKRSRGKKNSQGTKNPENILDMSSRTVSKLIKRMKVGCCICGWNEALCDVHHIIPKKLGGTNDNNNLTILCPNHHRLMHEGAVLPIKSVRDHIGEEWRKFYYAHD